VSAPLWQSVYDDLVKAVDPLLNLFGRLAGVVRRKKQRTAAAAAQGAVTASSIPAMSPTLVGRAEAIDEIVDLFGGGERAVLVHGLSGVGKSALAIAVAHTMMDDRATFGSIPVFHWLSAKASDVTDVRDTEWMIDRVYRALGFQTSTEITRQTKEEQIARTLSERPTCFLIDNFESVSDDTTIPYLLNLPASSRLLITSRVSVDPMLPLRSYPLRELDPVKTLELLETECERSQVPLPSEEDRYAIVRATGGSPLAVKWSVGLLGGGYRVGRALAVLRSGKDDLFQTLFSDHWSGLGDAARSTLCATALLGETFSRELLDAFFGSPSDVGELLRRRLIEPWDEQAEELRLTLHPLTRTFAQARIGETIPADELVSGMARTLTAYFNDRRLLQHGRSAYLSVDHDVASVLKVAERLVPKLDATVPDVQACSVFVDLFEAVSVPLWSFGYWGDRVELGRLALAAAEVGGDLKAAARAAGTVAIVKFWQGDSESAIAYGRRALDFAPDGENALDIAIGERVLALADARAGAIDEAVERLSTILATLKARKAIDHERVRYFADWPCAGHQGHLSGMVALNQEIGIMLVNAERYEEAIVWLEASEELARTISDAEGLSISQSHLGRCYLGMGDLAHAEAQFNDGLGLALEVARQSTTGRCWLGLAQVAGRRRQWQAMAEYAHEARAIFERLGMTTEFRDAEAIIASRGGGRRATTFIVKS
jgi:tetratricopeptide (TPR) repeat protein